MLKQLNRNKHIIYYSKMQNMAQHLQVKKNFLLYNSIVQYLSIYINNTIYIKITELNFKCLLNFEFILICLASKFLTLKTELEQIETYITIN